MRTTLTSPALLSHKKKPSVKNKQIYTFLITKTINLADGYKFAAKVLPSSRFIIVEIDAAGSRMDEHETSPRGIGTTNAKWWFDHTARHGETSRVFLNLAHF